MQPSFRLISIEGLTASVLTVQAEDSLPMAIHRLGLPQHRRTLVLVGGASKISQADFSRLQTLFVEVLAPLAERLDMVVVDGGTDAGVMKLMGNARTQTAGSFPLVGVAPVGLVSLPAKPSSQADAAPIEPHHTHCLLIPGSEWGDESPWIARTATAIAGDMPSVTILINGGGVTWKDAACSLEENRPIIVISGSGRTADVIAAALRGEPVGDERATALVDSGLLQAVDLDSEGRVLAEVLQSRLMF
ncbi:MAG: hypothetical protein HC873_09145 [Leptolyngbyaceae cyanobacterium SL_1_1]|nr:hypothetical protein [Leptolyngbyaceae cyanobacterium RM1_1_2]NJO09786.1 hypothetical protein [Leptolyngbyaceae cyanobacterium SL_1_1]